MAFVKAVIEWHDRWLLADSARVRPWMVFALGAVGVAGLSLCLFMEMSERQWLAALSGFAVGIAAEKFAQKQIRRVKAKFAVSD